MVMPAGFKLGRRPNDPSKPRITLGLEGPFEAVPSTGTFPIPASVDYASIVPAALWGMDGNDAVGDCTIADQSHSALSRSASAGNPLITATTAECLAAYSAAAGYDPSDPSTDQGAAIQDILSYAEKTGFVFDGKLHKIIAFAQIDHTNIPLMKWCIANFDAVHLGINFPSIAMDQFNSGQPWTAVSNDGGIEGGHDIPIVGYGTGSGYQIVTWGQVQQMTPTFLTKYAEEAWISITQDFVNTKTGINSALDETLYQIGVQFASITKRPNPIPVPAPAPQPTPSPQPAPPAPASPTTVDIAFWNDIRSWAKGTKTMPQNKAAAARILAWASASGLS